MKHTIFSSIISDYNQQDHYYNYLFYYHNYLEILFVKSNDFSFA